MKKTIEKINETKRWFFKKTNKADKNLTSKKKKQRAQIKKIRNKSYNWHHKKYKGSKEITMSNCMLIKWSA